MPARRPKRGDRRIDAFIDHFAVMGYDARVIKAVVTDLHKVYGGDGVAWRVLQEGCFEIVQNRLLEIEDEEKQKQEQPQLLLEHHQQQDGQQVEDEPPQDQQQLLLLEHHQQQDCQQVEDELPQHQEEVEGPMFIEPQDIISISKVHNEVPAETESAYEEVEGPMLIEPAAREAVFPLNAAIRTGPRRPCYGWLSESEDEEEEQPIGQKHEVHVLSPGGRPQ